MPFFNSINRIKLSDSLIKEILQYLFSFTVAWVIASLFSDFPFFSEPVENSRFTLYYRDFLMGLTNQQLHWLGYQTYWYDTTLGIEGTAGLIIDYGCLGYRIVLFFVVFIILQFGSAWHKGWYLLLGTFLITWVNSLRLVIIAIGQFQKPELTVLVHDTVSPVLMYPLLLALWIIWLKTFGKVPTTDTLLYKMVKFIANAPLFNSK
ncbi:MAG: exosortase/archaeosortase family protein [Salinivirgaceae bacterium]